MLNTGRVGSGIATHRRDRETAEIEIPPFAVELPCFLGQVEMAKPDGTSVNPHWSLLLSQGKQAFDRCAFDTSPSRKPDA